MMNEPDIVQGLPVPLNHPRFTYWKPDEDWRFIDCEGAHHSIMEMFQGGSIPDVVIDDCRAHAQKHWSDLADKLAKSSVSQIGVRATPDNFLADAMRCRQLEKKAKRWKFKVR